MKYVQCLFVIPFLFFMNTLSFAHGNIVDYFLKNPSAWDDTKKIIHKTPTGVSIPDGLEGLGFNLTELTNGDEVAIIFLETQTFEKMKQRGFCSVGDKLLPGKNRVVSVIIRNSGDRTQFHYKFMLQRNIHSVPISIYNNGNAVLESRYDGSQPVTDISNLAGIELCEVDIR
ncbi:MAG: hypothetical protein HS132_06270 [Planctomycetia bacterium]|nr:hypothetical protein [Planctomycetia bacterium]